VRFGQDVRVAILSYRSRALWLLGYPEAAPRDNDVAVKEAREIAHATSLMYALAFTSLTNVPCGNFANASKDIDELAALADEKNAAFWKAVALLARGQLLILTIVLDSLSESQETQGFDG
jgi:hypothetical protein